MLSPQKREFNELLKQNDTLTQKNKVLRGENKAQKAEIAALKVQLEKASIATAMGGNAGSSGDGVEVETSPEDGNSKVGGAKKPKEYEYLPSLTSF